MAKTNFNRDRDTKEVAIFDRALELGLPMVGICRGGQFLNVMNKGKLWQHVTNHCGEHLAYVEVPPFRENGKRRVVKVTSTHHQMMIPTDEAVLLMTATEAYEKNGPQLSVLGKREPDVESCFYTDTNCLCFQPHPEFASCPPECVDIFEEFLDDWIYPKINKMEKVIIQQASVTPR
jgi:gamma-glutamyl-gamma-aminobutyrate hydrolase PuuD